MINAYGKAEKLDMAGFMGRYRGFIMRCFEATKEVFEELEEEFEVKSHMKRGSLTKAIMNNILYNFCL